MKSQKFFQILFIAILMATVSLANSLLAAEQDKIERIGGNFKVVKIINLPRGGFKVDFKAAEGTPKISVLHLESDHINAGLSEGSVIRLSADVIATKGGEAEISQVVVFLPGKLGSTPVWMLSKAANHISPPAKLIEMHAPSTDYAVF